MPAAKTAKRKVAKPNAKAKGKTTKAAKTNGTRGSRGDIRALVPEIVKKLKGGTTMTDIRAEYGSGPKVRKALMEKGYNTKGEKIDVAEVKGGGATLAKRVAKLREEGRAWYAIELATGKTESELRELLANHGYKSLAQGRVVKGESKPAKRTAKAKATKASTKGAATGKATGRKKVRKPVRKRAANPS